MARKVNVGLVGYKFMGKAHSNAYSDVAMFFDMDAEPVMKAVCGRNEEGVKAAAEKFGWEGYETSRCSYTVTDEDGTIKNADVVMLNPTEMKLARWIITTCKKVYLS